MEIERPLLNDEFISVMGNMANRIGPDGQSSELRIVQPRMLDHLELPAISAFNAMNAVPRREPLPIVSFRSPRLAP